MTNKQENINKESFADLFAKHIESEEKLEGKVVKGKIISNENDMVIIDVGYKAEGRIHIREFSNKDSDNAPEVGDEIDVYLEKIENKNGEAVLSREKAVKQNAWNHLQDAFSNNKVVKGVPFNKVKGGLSVDLDGVTAFLPGSQIDTRQIVKDTKELLNKPIDLMILKMDKFRGNIVVSRKAISDAEFEEQKKELLKNINEGSIVEGKVKNITDYGAFIALGGMDGLVHVTDLSWTKIS